MEKLTDRSPRTPPALSNAAPRCDYLFQPSGHQCQKEAGHERGHFWDIQVENAAAPPVAEVPAVADVEDLIAELKEWMQRHPEDTGLVSQSKRLIRHIEAAVAEGPAAMPPHSFATDAEFQAYTSQLYEQWRNRADATEDFDEWKVAEIKRLTQATVDQYNAGRASALAELDIATRANADAHRMVDVQCAENARLKQELAPAEPPEMNWVNLRGRLSDEEAATYKAAAAEPLTPNPVEARAAARKWLDENFQPHSQSGDYLRRDATDSAEYATWDLMAAYAADLQRQLNNWKANARTAREYWRSAEAANQELRSELACQWEANHAEHCGIWPHPDKDVCHWPKPAAMLGPQHGDTK
jgi:hypothetical protein